MKITLTKIKEYLRTYIAPLIATIMALGLWYYYGNGEYLWFLGLIGAILFINIWGYLTKEKEI